VAVRCGSDQPRLSLSAEKIVPFSFELKPSMKKSIRKRFVYLHKIFVFFKYCALGITIIGIQHFLALQLTPP